MIEVKRLRYQYPGQSDYTLKGIDFEIAQGEIFGFLGPSGAGKSTTQKVLIRHTASIRRDRPGYGAASQTAWPGLLQSHRGRL